MARLDRLAYRSPRQLLAEKFHLSDQLLTALNEGKDFARAGTDIVVANIMPLAVPKPSRTDGRRPPAATTGAAGESVKATRVVVDKSERSVRVLRLWRFAHRLLPGNYRQRRKAGSQRQLRSSQRVI
jgi:hypothetical protein